MLIVSASSSSASAQLKVTLRDGTQLTVRESALQNFNSSEAEREVSRILAVMQGVTATIKVHPMDDAGSGNAAAGLDATGTRVILYSPNFLATMKGGSEQRWAITGVFAHEIGHHLNGHTAASVRLGSEALRQQELDADEFAGVQMARLDATESQALTMLASAGENATFAHPGRAAREAAVRRGWCTGSGGKLTTAFAPATGQSGCIGGRGARGGAATPDVVVARPRLIDYNFNRGVAGGVIPEISVPGMRTTYALGGLALIQTASSREMLTVVPGIVMPGVVELDAEAFVYDGDPRGSGWGLGFGADANGAGYYVFTFNTEGKYGLLRHTPGGDWARIIGEVSAPDAFKKGTGDINKLAVRLNGSKATLVANGTVLTTVDLGAAPAGRPVLLATPARAGQTPTTVVFLTLRATPQ